MRTYVPMVWKDPDSPYTVFEEALKARDLEAIRAAAQRLPYTGRPQPPEPDGPHMTMREEARVLLMVAEQDPDGFDVAAHRWFQRLADPWHYSAFDPRARPLTFEELALAALALRDLSAHPREARRRLWRLCLGVSLHEVAEAFRDQET